MQCRNAGLIPDWEEMEGQEEGEETRDQRGERSQETAKILPTI